MIWSVLTKPWREINWGNKQADLQFIKTFCPLEGQPIRILLHGPVGSGKSSFINSIQTILHNRIYTQALAANASNGCHSKEVRQSFHIRVAKP
ncbi:hypothetical protein AMECASPLE_034346 [Ameca splendens]|uniref:KAP NTPase domain-containing protein n=1 Tax=Ameca splendens TaxID=208324 RepID=A0ABV0Z5D1_9TELE